MKARLPQGYGRPDPQAMMRQVQKMQDAIREKQAELEAKEYTGTASGELVTVTMTGKHEITAVKIKPEAVDPEDIEMLEDLIDYQLTFLVRIATMNNLRNLLVLQQLADLGLGPGRIA